MAVDVSVPGRDTDSERGRSIHVASDSHTGAVVTVLKEGIRLDREGLFALKRAVDAIVVETA